MGRTNPTYRDRLQAIEQRWGAYRRTLRRRDQPRFDQLFVYARDHADAAGMLNHEDRLAPVLISIDLEQERRIDELETRIEELETRIDTLEGHPSGVETGSEYHDTPAEGDNHREDSDANE